MGIASFKINDMRTNRWTISGGILLLLSTLLILVMGCNKDPYMPDGEATYYGQGDGRFGGNNEEQPLLGSIKIMTYNIHAGSPPAYPDSVDMPAIAKAIATANPDVVFLQEVDRGTNRNGYTGDQAKVLADSLKMNFIYYSAREYLRGFYGVAILSKYPLYTVRKYLLKLENESTEQRVLGTAYIDLPGRDSVMAAVTHLQHNSATNRLQQANDIAGILALSDAKVVFGADLNEQESATGFFNVFDQMLTRTCIGGNCPRTFNAQNPTSVIDYLAYRPATAFSVITHSVVAEHYASDHLPVIAELKFHR